MQALPLGMKVLISDDRIREWYKEFYGKVYIAYSGGKDSAVLKHMVHSLYPNVPVVYSDTGLEFNGVRKKGIENADEVLKPEMKFVDIIRKYGYPIISKEVANDVHGAKEGNTRWKKLKGELIDPNTGKPSQYNKKKYEFLLDAPFEIGDYCCLKSKKEPMHKYNKQTGRHPYIGMLASESQKRKRAWLKTGCNAYDLDEPQSNPLAFWTDGDILAYCYLNKIDLADEYGEIVYEDDDGFQYDPINILLMHGGSIEGIKHRLTTTGEKRTGCIFCLFGILNDKDRLLRVKKLQPKTYDFIMRGGHFNESGKWEPGYDENGVFGLGYKFVIDWLNEHGNLGIEY